VNKLYYCGECKRVVTSSESCSYCSCSSGLINELSVGASVNIIGTKIKGKVLKVSENTAKLLIRDEGNNKIIKEYSGDKLRKII
jgi:ATP sulfurylase